MWITTPRQILKRKKNRFVGFIDDDKGMRFKIVGEYFRDTQTNEDFSVCEVSLIGPLDEALKSWSVAVSLRHLELWDKMLSSDITLDRDNEGNESLFICIANPGLQGKQKELYRKMFRAAATANVEVRRPLTNHTKQILVTVMFEDERHLRTDLCTERKVDALADFAHKLQTTTDSDGEPQ